MRIETLNKQSVEIVIGEAKARDLLAGLLAHPELGGQAAELAEKLRAAGVQPATPVAHVRHEYAPPLTH